MKRLLGVLLLPALLTLGACGDEEPPVAPSSSTAPSEVVNPDADTSGASSETGTPGEESSIPPRAEQTSDQRKQIEKWYLDNVRNVADVGATSDKRLLKAAHTVCDSLDSGASFKMSYVMTALDFADDAEETAPIGAAMLTVKGLCPEHQPIVDAWSEGAED